jgi:hypothetical protein
VNRSRQSVLIAAGVLVLVAPVARAAVTPGRAPVASATGWWAASGASLRPAGGIGPGRASAEIVTVRSPGAAVRLTGRTVRAGLESVRGWIRATAGTKVVAVARLTDSAGRSYLSATLHLNSLWQTFGVTSRGATAGPLSVTFTAAPGSRWAPGTQIQLSAVTTADTGRSTLQRVSGTNEFTLTPYGGTAAPFVAHGYDYGPTPIGGTIYTPWTDPATCQADAQIMRGLGVTVAAASLEWEVLDNQQNLLQCADAFWAAGIGFAWLFPIQSTPADGEGFVQRYELELQEAISLLGNHPATYIWLVGNEMNLNGRDGSCFFDVTVPGQPACTDPTGGHYLAQLVNYVHTNDPGHPVSTKLSGDGGGGCTPNGVVSADDVPALDFWSVDEYPATTFGNAFTCLQQEDATRPALVTEFGNTRFLCNGTDVLNALTVDYSCPPGSREDDADQAYSNSGLWQNIVAAEATAANPDGELLGATQFMYSDLWWYSLGAPFNGGEAYSQFNHDTISVDDGAYPSGYSAFEWWGGTQAQLPGQGGDPRVTTPELAASAQVWGTTGLPFVSNVSIKPLDTPTSACTVLATWTTATPATSRVDWGRSEVGFNSFSPDHEILFDNTTYTAHQEDDTLTTNHQLVLTGPFVVGTYRFVVRGFDATYGSDAAAGIDVNIPGGTCL